MADHDHVPEADALVQAGGADPELIEVEDQPEIGVEVPEADAVEQSRAPTVPAAVAARPIPAEAPEHDVLDQRLDVGGDDHEDDFR